VYCLYLRLCSLNDKSIAGRCPVSIVITRNRTPSKYVCHGLYLYFSALSLGRASERLSYFFKRSHVSVWNWMQKYKPQRISYSRRKITGYIADETLIKAGSEHIWLWVEIEPKDKEILALTISKERNTFVAERFIPGLVQIYGEHSVSTDGGTWYPQACRFLGIKHHIHSPLGKSLIERTMQCIKDRTECFDDYFPCREKRCKLKHVENWMRFFSRLQ
jgi:putative transposase